MEEGRWWSWSGLGEGWRRRTRPLWVGWGDAVRPPRAARHAAYAARALPRPSPLPNPPPTLLQRVAEAEAYVLEVAAATRGGPVLVSVAKDFGWEHVDRLFDNLERLAAAVNARGVARLVLSTPRQYLDAKLGAPPRAGWPVQQGDLMPYADCKARRVVGEVGCG